MAKSQKPLISHETLKEYLTYNPDTGEFHFRIAPYHRSDLLGKRAGRERKNDNRRTIKLQQRDYLESRLAWYYMTGEWPEAEIDHKDHDPANNKLHNLREATSSENKWNQRRRTTKSKYKGVSPYCGKWRVQICQFYNNRTIGIYGTEEEAGRAYDAKAMELMGAFAKLNFPEGQ